MSRKGCRWDGEFWQSWVSTYANDFTFERRPQSVTHQKGAAKEADTIQILGNSLDTVYSFFFGPAFLPREKTKKSVMVAIHASHEMRVIDRHSQLEYRYASRLPLH